MNFQKDFGGELRQTNSLRGGLLQIVQMLIVGVVWFPFLKALDKRNVIEEKSFETEE